jgi:hypothetical protein
VDVREAVELELQEALRVEGIDLRNRTVTVPLAREQLYNKTRIERRDAELVRRGMQLATDKVLRNHYFDRIEKEVKLLEDDPQAFYDLVNKNVHSIFESAYIERLYKMHEKSKEA